VLGRLIQRMIWWELLKVFSLCFVAITGLLLMGGLFAEATQKGLEPGQILMVIPLLIPSTLPYTLPATTLFATCVVYGRMSHDNEILAIKAAGVNVMRVVSPGLLLGLTMSLTTAGLYYHVIPNTQFMLRFRVMEDIEEFLYTMLRKDNGLNYPQLPWIIQVKGVEGRKLMSPVFIRRDEKGNVDVVVRAREAELRVDLPNKQLIVKMVDCDIKSIDPKLCSGYLKDKDWPIDLPPDLWKKEKTRERDMNWHELFARREFLEEEIQKLQVRIASDQALFNLGNAPENLKKQHLVNLENEIRERRRWISSLEGEMHMRPALSLGCLCFVLVGCPVGIWFSRSDYLSAFITCFLPIVMLYYPALLCGISMGKSGKIPAPAIWGADGAMAVVSLWLYYKLLKN
jgi:lipopolysaccharide export system permease protein